MPRQGGENMATCGKREEQHGRKRAAVPEHHRTFATAGAGTLLESVCCEKGIFHGLLEGVSCVHRD
jgi:hypothetical protein